MKEETRLPQLCSARGRPFHREDNRKERAMGDKGGQKDKDKNKNKMIKKREDKAKKTKEKNQKPA